MTLTGNKNTVLVVGNGGREHALAWALARSASVGQVIVAAGNAGTQWEASAGVAPCQRVAIAPDDIDGLVTLAQDNAVALTVVGPEDPLVNGIVDRFTAADLTIFGPTAGAAQLEASKAFSKAFMERHGIPTAAYGAFTDLDEARAFVASFGRPLVVKADGLAEGKGVIMCETVADADAALLQMMQDRAFGAAGDQVVIEERLTGVEASVLAFCDGERFALMPIARDHKRALDGDQGLNTGGMGAVCPVPDVDAALIRMIEETVVRPTLDGMHAEGLPYKGVLYAGLMLTPDGLRVLEFNCRFGDPETEAIMPLFDGDLAAVLMACAHGQLDPAAVRWQAGACASVIVASGGYPLAYAKGLPISGLAIEQPQTAIFHAGTTEQDGHAVTARGRVLAVSGWGHDLDTALARAYARIETIDFEDMFYRHDIGRTVGSSQ